jgi:hypothetical protein
VIIQFLLDSPRFEVLGYIVRVKEEVLSGFGNSTGVTKSCGVFIDLVDIVF